MQYSRRCRKCGYNNLFGSSDEYDRCPVCDTPYRDTLQIIADQHFGTMSTTTPPEFATTPLEFSTTQAPLGAEPPPATEPSTSPPRPRHRTRNRKISALVVRLRQQTNYPAYREGIWRVGFYGYLFALVAAIGAFYSFWMHDLRGGLTSTGLILLALLLADYLTDLSHLAVDACDALLRFTAGGSSANISR